MHIVTFNVCTVWQSFVIKIKSTAVCLISQRPGSKCVYTTGNKRLGERLFYKLTVSTCYFHRYRYAICLPVHATGDRGKTMCCHYNYDRCFVISPINMCLAPITRCCLTCHHVLPPPSPSQTLFPYLRSITTNPYSLINHGRQSLGLGMMQFVLGDAAGYYSL